MKVDVVVMVGDKTEILKEIDRVEVTPDTNSMTRTSADLFPRLRLLRADKVVAVFNEWKYYIITN